MAAQENDIFITKVGGDQINLSEMVRSAVGQEFNGGTITEPLNVEVPADDENYLFFIQTPEDYDQGFGEVIQVQNFPGQTIMGLNVFGQLTLGSADAAFASFLELKSGTRTLYLSDGIQSELVKATDSAGKPVFRVLDTGVTIIGATAAPADGELVAGQMALWFDATNGAAKLKIKAKQANGTVVNGEVALA